MSTPHDVPDQSIPDQHGRTALVTGATGGLGLRVAEVLAAHGARVLIGCRNAERGAAALARVASVATGAAPELATVDLSDLASVRSAANDIRSRTGDRLDLLVNNGGVMAPPLAFSPDGFELQWATNVLGPAALTWLLLPAIEQTPGSRVVFVSSNRHAKGEFDESRMRAEVRGIDYGGAAYRGFDYYGRTKFADLLLAHQLDRHFRTLGSGTARPLALAAHPGFAATGIVGNGFAGLPRFAHRIATAATGILGQPVEAGALPILFAVTAAEATGDAFYGPSGFLELRGGVGEATRSAASRDDALGDMLDRVVAELTGVPAPTI